MSGFISKPVSGWIHADSLITKEGATYAVRVSSICYLLLNFHFNIIFCMSVCRLFRGEGVHENVGLQNPHQRCKVSKHSIPFCCVNSYFYFYYRECINRVCEAAGLKTVDKKRKVDKDVQKAIAKVPKMECAGTNVNLNVSSSSLTLTSLDTGQIIASHDMPRISFASGGDCVSVKD